MIDLHRLCTRRALGAAALLSALCSPTFALPPIDPIDPTDPIIDPPITVSVSGALVFRGCTPAASDVLVRIAQTTRTARPSSPLLQADGSLRMNYSIVVGPELTAPAQVVVKAEVAASACGAGSFSPASQSVAPGATGVNFNYQAITTGTFNLPADAFALIAGGFVNQIGLRLHNDGSQGSFVTIDGNTTAFNIATISKDLPGPIGSGKFSVRDMNKNGGSMTRNGSVFNMQLRFEQNGIEIKGRHSVLGDLAMPDFQMTNPALDVRTVLLVRSGQLELGFTNASLSGSISSTGGCNVFGIDWCNFLFGTSGTVRTAFARAALAQLQNAFIQNAVKARLASALASRGITGLIGTARVIGDQIVITTIASGPACGLRVCTIDPIVIGGGVFTQQ